MIDQGSSELNIIVGVEADDFETAVTAIYHAFAPRPNPARAADAQTPNPSAPAQTDQSPIASGSSR